MNKKSFDNHYFYKYSQIIYCGLLHNLGFTLINLPLFIAITTLTFSFEKIFLYLIVSLTLFPSIFLLMYYVNEFNRLQMFPQAKEYLTIALQGIKKTLPFSLITNFMFFVVYISINYAIQTGRLKFFPPVYLTLFIFLFGLSLTYLYFSIRNPLKTVKVLIKATFYLSIRKFYLTLLNVILFSCFILFLFIKPIIGFFFLPSIVGIILYKNCSLFLTYGTQS